MRSIEALPEPVRSSVRSGIIVYDLARVVEELVFNSLDAGATKVSVYIGVGTCYIKVVDNGCGVSRDGLVLLGERYATSKFKQPTVLDTARGSFGFRGEALCSISDISLLEIISKAHGRPNGYRKVMKGSKCLYLEIDNDRQDVGTTVVARDLFYNQPVRRKHMQSSSKKVLHSVKKCVLRIALMHSEVCFKVLDVESEDELLCANPSKSPLLLLKSGFGIDISTLQKLNVSDRMLSLTGYISGPFDAFYVKAFQYIYINSRFICKGPIHKLLNQLAVDINCSEPLKDDAVSQNRKRSRFQANPSYILNIICPRDCYDLTFEPSKTTVEFKDWNPVLSFIEHAVTRVWSVNECHGDSFGHALDISGKKNDQNKSNDFLSASEDYKTVKKRFRSQKHQISLDLLSSCSVSHMENCDYAWSDGASCQNHHGNALEFKECESNMGVVFQSACSYEPYGGAFVQGRVRENPGSDDHLFIPEPVIFCSEDMLGNDIFAIEKSEKYMDNSMSSTWEDMHLEAGAKMNSGLLSDAMFLNCSAMNDDVKEVEDNIRKPVLKCCFFRQSLIPDGEIFTNDDEFTFQTDSFTPRQKQLNQSIRTNKRELGNRNLGIEPKTLWKDEAAIVWSSPRPKSSSGIDSLSRYSMRSPSTGGYTTEDNLPPDMGAKSNRYCSNDFSKWTALTTNPCFGTKIQDKEHFIDSYLPERHSKYDRSSRYLYLAEDHFFSFDTIKDGSKQEYCMSSRRQDGYAGSEEDFFKFQGHNLDDIPFPNCTDFSDKGWLYLDSCGINKTYFAALLQQNSSSKFSDENKNSKLQKVTRERENKCEKVLQRSHSAPPFYRGKRKFFALNTCSIVEDGKSNIQSIHTASTWTGTGNLTHHDLSSNLGFKQDSLFDSRPDMYETSDIADFQNFQMQDEYLHIKDLSSKETQDPMHERLKWRNSCPQALGKSGEHSHNLQDPILDISSGILHLAGDSLVTKFINKKCLENAKVLPQVDRKFIPVVANGTLAIVDQHAADERIRLEELRQKVLSGEMKTTKYLDAEQELVLPEIGYQLLHNYAEQVQSWGWICNIHLQGSRSFKKNLNLLHRQPTVATLLAVPCILGVNLTDMDLLEFLQQLADTDGSSTMPPSVLRVLNSKACRGAIMFGDSLLPSECSLIVEELKKTSLCFQCAHGRPTTAPLVNLEILHAQLAKLGLCGDGSPNELWHGLCRHEVTLERAMNRVSIAGDQG